MLQDRRRQLPTLPPYKGDRSFREPTPDYDENSQLGLPEKRGTNIQRHRSEAADFKVSSGVKVRRNASNVEGSSRIRSKSAENELENGRNLVKLQL